MKLPAIGATSDVPEAFPMGPTSPNADRDTALDHDPAAVGPARPADPTGPTPSEVHAEADVDAALAAARVEAGIDAAAITPPIQDPLQAIRSAGS